jgi:hypothetical protein
MNVSAKFMIASAAAASAALTAARTASAPCSLSTSAGHHVRARRQPQLSIGDDFVPCRHAFGDHHVVALLTFDHDIPHLGRAIRCHDVDELPGLRRLHGNRRYDGRARIGPQDYVHLDEQPGPESMIRVLERRLEPDRAGCRIDGVVDERHLTRLDCVRRGAWIGRRRGCPLCPIRAGAASAG